jgi:hypothetical protein
MTMSTRVTDQSFAEKSCRKARHTATKPAYTLLGASEQPVHAATTKTCQGSIRNMGLCLFTELWHKT